MPSPALFRQTSVRENFLVWHECYRFEIITTISNSIFNICDRYATRDVLCILILTRFVCLGVTRSLNWYGQTSNKRSGRGLLYIGNRRTRAYCVPYIIESAIGQSRQMWRRRRKNGVESWRFLDGTPSAVSCAAAEQSLEKRDETDKRSINVHLRPEVYGSYRWSVSPRPVSAWPDLFLRV